MKKALVILAVAAYWLFDDIIVFLSDGIVNTLGGAVFSLTGNGYRFEEFKTFWYKEKPVTPVK